MKLLSKLSSFQVMRIKYKLFFLFLMIALIVCLTTIQLHRYTFSTYDRQLYKESANVLNLSSTVIEMELRKLERLSFNFIADPQMQSLLRQLRNEQSEYERYRLHVDLNEKLQNYTTEEQFIAAIHFIDTEGNELIAGNRIRHTPEETRRSIAQRSREKKGDVIWQAASEGEQSVILSRAIRSYSNLTLDYLGTLMIRIDMHMLVNRVLKKSTYQEGRLSILSNNEVIYTNAAQSDLLPLPDDSATSGYEITREQGQQVFKTYVKSAYTEWNYMNVIPYGTIFHSINMMKNIIYMIYAALFLFVVVLGFKLSKSITLPIISLNGKMKKVGAGNFTVAQQRLEQPFAMDEIGQLHRNFDSMVQRINELIDENYAKQLTIKDSEFRALQAQINPHFLYNTLESINWQAKLNRQPQISAMVEALGSLMRFAIGRQKHLIQLGEELQIVEHYITIQKFRFEDRLHFEMRVPEHLRDSLMPKLTLQPLLENSIQYGLEQMTTTCYISVEATASEGVLELRVSDNGPGMDAELVRTWRSSTSFKGNGIGLTNIDERIKQTFGPEYGLDITSKPGEGTTVLIRMPDRKENHHV